MRDWKEVLKGETESLKDRLLSDEEKVDAFVGVSERAEIAPVSNHVLDPSVGFEGIEDIATGNMMVPAAMVMGEHGGESELALQETKHANPLQMEADESILHDDGGFHETDWCCDL